MDKRTVFVQFGLSAVITLTTGVASVARATDYTITTFAIPGYSTSITGINDSGQFVGNFTTNGDVYYSFLQSPGAATVALQDPATSASRSVVARGINDQGDIVGTYQTLSGGAQSFEYTPAGGYTDIGQGSTTTVNAITNAGQYFGSAKVSAYGPSTQYFYAYLNYGNNTSLEFPDGGASAPSLSPQENEGTFGLGINNYGAMVGDYVTRTGTGQYDTFGYLYDKTGFSVIAPPGATDSIARGINDAGDIVGNYDVSVTDADSGETTTSFYNLVYIGGQYQVFYLPGAVQTDLYGINNAGVIVGDVQYPDQDTEGFIATPALTTGPTGFDRGPFPGFPSPPVPEPSTWALTTIGVGGLGAMMRRRRRSAHPSLTAKGLRRNRAAGQPPSMVAKPRETIREATMPRTIGKTALGVVVLAGILATANPAAASVDFSTAAVQVTQVAPGSYTFVEAGFSDGARITGSFDGTDINNDGQLSYFTNPPEPAYPLELTDFTLSFSGNSLVPAFSLDFPQLDNFNYQLGPTLGASSVIDNGLTEGIEAGSTNRFYIAGPGPLAPCDGINACGGVLALPEPATWTVLLVGLAAIGGALRAARRPPRHARGPMGADGVAAGGGLGRG